MNPLRRCLPVCSLALLFAGCSTTYGVRREAPLIGTLRMSCVEQAVRAAPGVSDVRMLPPDSLQYQVRGKFGQGKVDHLWPTITVKESNSGAKSFVNAYQEKDYVPSAQEVATVHATMVGVETAIFKNCVYAPSQGQITEKCTGVRC